MVEKLMVYKGFPIVSIFRRSGYRDACVGIPKGNAFYGYDFTESSKFKPEPLIFGRIKLCEYKPNFFQETENEQYWWVWLFGDCQGDAVDVKGLIEYYGMDKDPDYTNAIIRQIRDRGGYIIQTIASMQDFAKKFVDWVIKEEKHVSSTESIS